MLQTVDGYKNMCLICHVYSFSECTHHMCPVYKESLALAKQRSQACQNNSMYEKF